MLFSLRILLSVLTTKAPHSSYSTVKAAFAYSLLSVERARKRLLISSTTTEPGSKPPAQALQPGRFPGGAPLLCKARAAARAVTLAPAILHSTQSEHMAGPGGTTGTSINFCSLSMGHQPQALSSTTDLLLPAWKNTSLRLLHTCQTKQQTKKFLEYTRSTKEIVFSSLFLRRTI